MECYVVDYIYHVMMCTGKYIQQLANMCVCDPHFWQVVAKLLSTVEETHLVWFLVFRFDVHGCRQ